MAKKKRKTREQRPAIGEVIAPGVVKLTCGCSAERRALCKQRGFWVENPLTGPPRKRPNEHCHIFVTEGDLIEMAHDVVRARFSQTSEAESRLVNGELRATPDP